MASRLKFLQLNVICSSAITDHLGNTVHLQGIDVASLNEQRVFDVKIVGTPDGFSEIKSRDHSRAAFWVKSQLKYCMVLNTRDIVAIRCAVLEKHVRKVSCYCCASDDNIPILTQPDDLVDPLDNFQFVGDFNAKSFVWGKRPTDPWGEEVISFTLKYDLKIMNKPESMATFDGHQGESWIDLHLIRKCTHRIADWTIDNRVTLSEHNATAPRRYSVKIGHKNSAKKLNPINVEPILSRMYWYERHLVAPFNTSIVLH